MPRTPERSREWLIIGAGTVLLLVVWWWAPARVELGWQSLLQQLQRFGNRRLAPLWVVGVYVVGGFVVLPLTLLIVATVAAFGAPLGMLYALLGSVGSAIITFAIGRALGEPMLRRLFGHRFHALQRRLAASSVMSLTAVRLLPLAPFSVVNVLAGTAGVRFVPYVIGTSLGILPGIAALGLVASGLSGENTVALFSLAFGSAMLGGLAIAKRRVASAETDDPPGVGGYDGSGEPSSDGEQNALTSRSNTPGSTGF